nr:hypothetical protein [Tanacetum cinerariifolium]
MQGLSMEVDLYVLPMKGLDVVLGIQWLQKLGKVTHDYAQQTMEFTLEDVAHTLQGDVSLRMKPISLHNMQALLDTNDTYGVYELQAITRADAGTEDQQVTDVITHPDINQLITRFESLFQVLTSLPPHRLIDLHIHLVPSTKPMNVRPYLYPYYQKNEMEKLDYASIAAPLSSLLQKNEFKLGEVEAAAFDAIKHQLSRAPILGLPNFDDIFVVEADASSEGIGAMLLQNGQPISFFSRKVGPHMHVAATYRKELFAIVEAVYKWRQYLVGRPYTIRTDHKSIKELMQQVVDALSRMYGGDEEEVTTAYMAISQSLIVLLNNLRRENESLEELCHLHQCLDREFHNTLSAGHDGTKKMLTGLSALFYWKGMRKSVEEFIRNCLVCQQTKYCAQVIGGLLQPLPTPTAVWEDVSMDFITGLPASKGLTVILVVVDR